MYSCVLVSASITLVQSSSSLMRHNLQPPTNLSHEKRINIVNLPRKHKIISRDIPKNLSWQSINAFQYQSLFWCHPVRFRQRSQQLSFLKYIFFHSLLLLKPVKIFLKKFLKLIHNLSRYILNCNDLSGLMLGCQGLFWPKIFWMVPSRSYIWPIYIVRNVHSPLSFNIGKTSQELRMLSSVTINCQVTKIVMNSGSQLSEL